MTNKNFLDDVNLGFGPDVYTTADRTVIRWSDCGGSELYAFGDEEDVAKVAELLRYDSRELPGDEDDDEDDRALVEFWDRVENAIREVCGYVFSSRKEIERNM